MFKLNLTEFNYHNWLCKRAHNSLVMHLSINNISKDCVVENSDFAVPSAIM